MGVVALILLVCVGVTYSFQDQNGGNVTNYVKNSTITSPLLTNPNMSALEMSPPPTSSIKKRKKLKKKAATKAKKAKRAR